MGKQGIIVEYKIDRKYFKVGGAYRLRLGVNKYVHAVCTAVTDKSIVMAHFSENEFHYTELSIHDLMYSNNYEIYKLTEDYKDGKFEF